MPREHVITTNDKPTLGTQSGKGCLLIFAIPFIGLIAYFVL